MPSRRKALAGSEAVAQEPIVPPDSPKAGDAATPRPLTGAMPGTMVPGSGGCRPPGGGVAVEGSAWGSACGGIARPEAASAASPGRRPARAAAAGLAAAAAAATWAGLGAA